MPDFGVIREIFYLNDLILTQKKSFKPTLIHLKSYYPPLVVVDTFNRASLCLILNNLCEFFAAAFFEQIYKHALQRDRIQTL